MGRKKQVAQTVMRLTGGVLKTTTDLLLWQLYYTGALVGKRKSALSFTMAMNQANDTLKALNASTMYRAIQFLITQRLIDFADSGLTAAISAAGLKRLKSELPFYDTERIWDKKIYLITYDIAEKQSSDRNTLRSYLRKMGCGKLQASVWIAFYNPKRTLQSFINEHNLHGSVIISTLGKDGAIGDSDLQSLIQRIYHLDKINQRYAEFITNYQGKSSLNSQELSFSFLSILHTDPQLPFEILPENWLGEKAYTLFLNHKKEHIRNAAVSKVL